MSPSRPSSAQRLIIRLSPLYSTVTCNLTRLSRPPRPAAKPSPSLSQSSYHPKISQPSASPIDSTHASSPTSEPPHLLNPPHSPSEGPHSFRSPVNSPYTSSLSSAGAVPSLLNLLYAQNPTAHLSPSVLLGCLLSSIPGTDFPSSESTRSHAIESFS
uniref:Uncharacterized protein n=1 Tax=Knipowitschia caucasica TaxID=637954 RepID=A0AAV2LBX8_KNICA